ncbi:MAG: hypothetical protein HKP62_06490 [Sulfurovum sp.]|nr:hypothetical protein [Sulfurovum sp.]NNJ45644.1 hypothetical protein [Sulfurovum sp.]
MTEQDKDLSSKLGIDIHNNKINIDLNQTRNFFNTLKQTFEDTAQTIQKDISEGKVDMADDVGIKIDKENINIDLEKTKNFVEDIGKKIEGFLSEIDKVVEKIDKKK